MSMPEAMKLEDEEEDFIELDTENYADFDPICYPTLFHNLNIRLGKNIRDIVIISKIDIQNTGKKIIYTNQKKQKTL